MSRYHLAQLNIATLKAPLDSPLLADFVNNLDRINAIADTSPGFVWRLQAAAGNATEFRPLGDDVIVNLSVWTDVAALRQYVYASGHLDVMRRRKDWFERMAEAYMVLWWIPSEHRPTISEAIARLEMLKRDGPTAQAFTFRHAYPAPDVVQVQPTVSFGPTCPAT